MASWCSPAPSSPLERRLAALLLVSLPGTTDSPAGATEDPAGATERSPGAAGAAAALAHPEHRPAPGGPPALAPEEGRADADEEWLESLEDQLPARGSLERVAQLHASVARLQALEADALVGFARAHAPRQDRPVEQPDGSWAVPARSPSDARVVDEVAPMLSVGRRTAALRLAEADQLRRCLPVTAELLGLGFIDYAVAKAVADETAALTEDLAAEVDAGLAGVLVGAPAGRVRREVRRLVAVADAGAVAVRVRAATRARCVTYAPLPDGMATLSATGPAPAVRAWYEELTSRALDSARAGTSTDPFADLAGRAGDRDQRSLDERRFDALGEALGDALDAAGEGEGSAAHPCQRRRGAGTRVELVVGRGTLRGEDDLPGELSGHGPVPADVARAWARTATCACSSTRSGSRSAVGDAGPPRAGEGGARSDGSPRGAPTGPAGRPPSGAGARVRGAGPCPVAAGGGGPYVVPVALAREVRSLLPRCTAPGCSVPASRCDLDHAVPWPQGPTCACNLHPLCRTHHRMKTVRGWSVRPADPSGRLETLVWTSPLGHRYETAPEVRWSHLGHRPAGRSSRRSRRAVSADPPSVGPPTTGDRLPHGTAGGAADGTAGGGDGTAGDGDGSARRPAHDDSPALLSRCPRAARSAGGCARAREHCSGEAPPPARHLPGAG